MSVFVWPVLKVHVLSSALNVVHTPAYQTAGAAGFDLQAAIHSNFVLQAGARETIPTGLIMAIPEGYEGQVRPRSGMALKHGVTVLNAPGTVDSDYRGEVKVILHNTSGLPFIIKPGDRIAQMVIAAVSRLDIQSVGQLDSLGDTVRGDAGFGSTGA